MPSAFGEFAVEGDYARDGAVCVRQAFEPRFVRLATEAIEQTLAEPSSLFIRASDAGDGAFVEDFRRWQQSPVMEAFIRDSPAAAIAAQLMDSRTVRLHHDHVLVKEAGTRQRTRWHQDLPYYDIAGSQHTSMWFPVDAVARASSLECIAGSHRGQWFLPRTFLDHQAKWFPAGSLAELPDIESDPDRWPVLGWDLEPGDAVFFDMLTIHGAGGVDGDQRRRVLSLRFIGDDIVHDPRPWTTSPPFDDVELMPGEPFDHPMFPLLISDQSTNGH